MLNTLSMLHFPSCYLRPMYGPWPCTYCHQVAVVAPLLQLWHRDIPLHLRCLCNAKLYPVDRPACVLCSRSITLDRLWNARLEAEAGEYYAGTPLDWNVERMRLEWGVLANHGN